ncbi:MAG TPA: MFS transporter [Pseudolysinimonas sp.]|nr:MFS transporter [Pseudolysinimonas sp.]
MTSPILPAPSPLDSASEVMTKTLKTLKLRGLLSTLTLLILTLSVTWGAITGLLLAIQVQIIDPEGYVGSLALIVGCGAIAAMLAAPIAGAVTDRTRTRWGGRVPWMLGAAVATLGVCILFIFANSIAFLLVCAVLLQITTNFINTPATTYIPTRVPVERRGIFSSMVGLATLIGAVVGTALGATLAGVLAAGYITLGVLVVVMTTIFALVNRRSNIDDPKEPWNVGALFRTFWVNPVRYPNFAFVFSGRFLLFAGYFAVSTYGFYLLQNYIGLGEAAVGVVPLLGLVGLVAMIIAAPIGGVVLDKIGRAKPLIYVTTAIMAVGLLVPLFMPTLPGMLIYAFVTGIGFGAYQSIDFVLVTQVLPSQHEAGKDLGIINMTTTLPQTIGVAVAGTVVTVFDNYAALFPIAAGAAILGALLLIPVRGVR